MAKIVAPYLMFTLASSILAANQYGIGRGLAFDCILQSTSERVVLFLETEMRSADGKISNQRALEILRYLNAAEVYEDLRVPSTISIESRDDICKVNVGPRESSIPVTLLITPVADVAIAMVHPESGGIFSKGTKSIATLSSNKMGNFLELLIDKTSHQQSHCPPANRMQPIFSETPGIWTVHVDSLGYLSPSGYEALSTSATQARISTSTSGIVLPGDVFDAFLTRLELSVAVFARDGKHVIHDCHSNGSIVNARFPWIVMTLSGQNGYGIRFNPIMYLDAVMGSKTCELKVSRGSEMIIGDLLFRSGFVEFLPDRKMNLCPLDMYHATDKAFDMGLSGQDVPLPANTKADGTVRVERTPPDNGTQTFVIIGVLAGGIALIFGVIGFFVYKARTRKAVTAGDDPRRPMTDPSVNSETSSVVRV